MPCTAAAVRAALEQAQDPLGGALHEVLEVVVGGQGHGHEGGGVIGATDPDVVGEEEVEVRVEVEGGAEALDAGDGAAAAHRG